MTNKTMINRWINSVQNNYGSPSIALVKGKGIVVTDADGKQYLDFLGGIATNILGHAHPAIVKAVTKQVSILSHVSNFYVHPNAVELAEKLASMTGDKSAKVFFCQSGAEAPRPDVAIPGDQHPKYRAEKFLHCLGSTDHVAAVGRTAG